MPFLSGIGSGGGSGNLFVSKKHIFPSEIERDTYFNNYKNELKNGVVVYIENLKQFQRYDKDSNKWIEIVPAIPVSVKTIQSTYVINNDNTTAQEKFDEVEESVKRINENITKLDEESNEVKEDIKINKKNIQGLKDKISTLENKVISLKDLSDVDEVLPTEDGSILYFDLSKGQWINKKLDLTNSSIKEWSQNTEYKEKLSFVIYEDKLYRAKEDHKSINIFEETKWTLISGNLNSNDFDKKHTSLDKNSLNSDNNFLHMSKVEKDKYDAYGNQIKNLDDRVTALEGRVTDIENNPSGGNTVAIINNDVNLNGKNLDYHSITEAKFRISGVKSTDRVEINDLNKMIFTPSNIIKGAPVVQNIGGSRYVVCQLQNLDFNQSYKIQIAPMLLIVNDSILSTTTLTCGFNTLSQPNAPIIENSMLNGKSNLDINTLKEVRFKCHADGVLALKDGNKYTCTPKNIINNIFKLENDELVAGFLTCEKDMEYTIILQQGIISNDEYSLNCDNIATKFSTMPSMPIITNSNLNNNLNVDTLTTHSLTFPITSETGRTLGGFNVDSSKISVTKGNIVISNTIINGDSLNILFTGNLEGEDVELKLGVGSIFNQDKNGNKVFNDTEVVCKWTFDIKNVVIDDCIENTNKDVNYRNITSLKFPLHFANNLKVNINDSKISIIPNIKNGIATVDSNNNLIIPINVNDSLSNKNIDVEIKLGAIILKNDVTNHSISNNDGKNNSFRFIAKEPIIQKGNLDTNTAVDYINIKECLFPVIADDVVSINKSDIEFTEDGVAKDFTAIYNEIDKKLQVGFSLQSDKKYVIKIKQNAIKNRNTSNIASTQICSFETASQFKIGQSVSNGLRLSNTISSIAFPIVNANGVVTVSDNSKILAENCTISNISISGNNLIVEIKDLQCSTDVRVIIKEGLIKDNVMINQNTPDLITTFTIIGDNPIVKQDDTFNNNQHVKVNTAYIDYDIIASGEVKLIDNSKIITVPAGIITSANIIGAKGSYKLRLNLNLANKYNENITITIASNCIENDGTENNSSVITSFKTIFDSPIVKQSVLNGTWQENTFVGIDFDVNNTDSSLIIDNANNITAIGCTISEKNIKNGKLHLELSNIQYSTPLTINIGANSIKNSDNGNINTISCKLNIKGNVPKINNANINGNNNVPYNITFVEFPINASGIVTIKDISKVSIPNSFDNIINNISVVGDKGDYKLRVDLKPLQYNKDYKIQIDGQDVLENDKTFSDNTCTLDLSFHTESAKPVIQNAVVNGTRQNKSITEIIFPIIVEEVKGVLTCNKDKITGTNCFINNATIEGDVLKVAISKMDFSSNIVINLNIGTVMNNNIGNDKAVECEFNTKGDIVNVEQSSLNKQTDVDSTIKYIDYKLSASKFGNLTVDNSKIAITPVTSLINSGIYDDGLNKYLRLEVNLIAGSPITVDLSKGVIVNDETFSDSNIHTEFTTGSSSKKILWREEFLLPNSVAVFDTSKLANTFTDEEFWGTEDKGYTDNSIIVIWKGYKANDGNINMVHKDDSCLVPRSGLDTFNNGSPDGGVAYDSSGHVLMFDNASMSNKIYNIIKYSN